MTRSHSKPLGHEPQQFNRCLSWWHGVNRPKTGVPNTKAAWPQCEPLGMWPGLTRIPQSMGTTIHCTCHPDPWAVPSTAPATPIHGHYHPLHLPPRSMGTTIHCTCHPDPWVPSRALRTPQYTHHPTLMSYSTIQGWISSSSGNAGPWNGHFASGSGICMWFRNTVQFQDAFELSPALTACTHPLSHPPPTSPVS
jgi:hypothetical protein